MKHIGLFEGIGGFSLAARWMGWETLAWCEWNEFGQKVLKHHFPKAIGHGDITKTDFTIYRGQCDILTGGFPCQPYSAAGKRLGKEDDRHLWPEMLRAIREIQPGWVVGENVRGLTNWNGGLVFDEVQADLEAEGYEVLPFLLPACAVNAPHRRDRIWFIAYSNNAGANNGIRTNGEWQMENKGWKGQPQFKHRQDGSNGFTENADSIRWTGNIGQEEPNEWQQREFSTGNNERIQTDNGEIGDVADTSNKGLERSARESIQRGSLRPAFNSNGIITNANSNQRCKGRMYKTEQQEAKRYVSPLNARSYERTTWQNFPTQPPICGRDDGISTRLVGITFPKHRNESIKAYGNAIVPQVAFEIFKAIELMAVEI